MKNVFKLKWLYTFIIIFVLAFTPVIALAGTTSSSSAKPSTPTSTSKSSIDLSKKSTTSSSSTLTPSTSNNVSKSVPSTSGLTNTSSSKNITGNATKSLPSNTTVTKKTFLGSTYSNGSSSSFHFSGTPYSYGYHPRFTPSWYSPYWYNPYYYMHPVPVVVTSGDFGFSFLIMLIILGAIGYGVWRVIKRKNALNKVK